MQSPAVQGETNSANARRANYSTSRYPLPSYFYEIQHVLQEYKVEVHHLIKVMIKVALRESTKQFFTKVLRAAASISTLTNEPTAGIKSQLHHIFTSSSGVAMTLVDIVQFGLEYHEYEGVGKKIGLWGNIAMGAIVGSMIGGVLGGTVGACVGFGIWAIGEAVAQTTIYQLS